MSDVDALYQELGRKLQEHRSLHHENYRGLVHVSVEDMQKLSNHMAQRDATKYNKLPKFRKITHGDQARIFGVRVVANRPTALGAVELES